MLLAPSDLPSPGWKILSEDTWLTGSKGSDIDSDVLARARALRSFTAWRSFLSSARGGLWTSVMPFATLDDAKRAVPQISVEANPRFSGTILERRSVSDQVVPGVDSLRVTEDITQHEDGLSISRYFCGNVERVALILGCSKRGDEWDWQESLEFVSLQADKISRAASHSAQR